MGTSYNLLERINAAKAQREPAKFGTLHPVRMSPFVRRLNAKQLPVKVIGGTPFNGSWTPDGDGGAA